MAQSLCRLLSRSEHDLSRYKNNSLPTTFSLMNMTRYTSPTVLLMAASQGTINSVLIILLGSCLVKPCLGDALFSDADYVHLL